MSELRFTDRIDEALLNFAQSKAQDLSELGDDASGLIRKAENFARGGKHLRPAFCLAGWLAAGGAQNDDRLIKAAAALEWLQASALVHDDLMDGSDTRRGKPAAHKYFANLHQENNWQDDPQDFGLSGAVLLGDLLLMWCDEMFHTSGFAADTLLAAAKYLDLAKTEVTIGQYLDVVGQFKGADDLNAAMQVVRFKSAKYTIERPLHIGATLAGGDETLIRTLSDVGLPLGEAFQLRDDILGVFGDPELTGKPAGDDLTSGKRTVLLALASQMAEEYQKQAIERVIGNPGATVEDIAAVREVFVDTGAVAKTEAMIDSLVEQANRALNEINSAAARAELEKLSKAVTRRER